MQDRRQESSIRTNNVCIVFLGILVFAGMAALAVGGQQEQVIAPGPATERSSVAAEAVEHENDQPPQPALQERNRRYRLCNGDSFDLIFPFTPEFNQTAVTVQPDGYINLSGLGDMYVAGKTVSELKESLEKRYAGTLHEPVINVVLKDFQKPYFIATGELARPGKYELREDLTLTQAVAVAGGFTENSKHSEVMLFRRVSNNWVEIKKVDVKKMFKTADLAEDMHLQPGDMVFVPQNRYSKVKRYIPSPGVGLSVNPY